MSSIEPIVHPSIYPEYYYNFVILQNKEDHSFLATPLPEPSKIHFCPRANAQIWLYNDRELDVIFNRKLDLFKQKLTDHFNASGNELPGIVGQVQGSQRVAHARHDKAGCLSYGPYFNLKQGKYRVIVHYSAKNKLNPVVGYIDMGRFSGRRKVLHQENLTRTSSGEVAVVLDIPLWGFKQFEVRTWFSGEGELKVQSLDIVKLPI